ncbi:MAG: hypothetical protein ABW221_25815 [Vicinamibacteria bacterium]
MLAALLLVVLQEPAIAPSPKPSPTAVPAAPAPAARQRERKAGPPPTKGERKFIHGTMGGIDAEAGTIRFVDEQGTQRVWKVDEVLAANSPARAQALASAFQPGQPITVTYQEDGPEPRVVNLSKRAGEKRDK